MTNKQRQKALDSQKWYVSEAMNDDRSGKMGYCRFCEHSKNSEGNCNVSHEERVSRCYCATAYNRKVRFGK